MKKALKIIVWSAFVFYCLVLLYIFVLDRVSHIRPYESIREFLLSVNLIPFKTVYEYIEKIINNRINVDTAITNLIGNIIVFLPMGAFLPCLFKKMRSFKKTVLTVFFIVLGIELIEIILAMGAFDIDDFIFNLGGAMIGYALVCIPLLKRLFF
jgi:glycopeptide antibiotics resistance protein